MTPRLHQLHILPRPLVSPRIPKDRSPHSYNMRLMSPTSPESSDQDLPLLTPTTDSSSNASSETDPPETPINSPDSDDQKKTTLFKDLQRDPPPAPQTSHRLPQPTEPPASAYLVSPYPESVHCWRPRKDNTGKIKYGACWGPLQTGKKIDEALPCDNKRRITRTERNPRRSGTQLPANH